MPAVRLQWLTSLTHIRAGHAHAHSVREHRAAIRVCEGVMPTCRRCCVRRRSQLLGGASSGVASHCALWRSRRRSLVTACGAVVVGRLSRLSHVCSRRCGGLWECAPVVGERARGVPAFVALGRSVGREPSREGALVGGERAEDEGSSEGVARADGLAEQRDGARGGP